MRKKNLEIKKDLNFIAREKKLLNKNIYLVKCKSKVIIMKKKIYIQL